MLWPPRALTRRGGLSLQASQSQSQPEPRPEPRASQFSNDLTAVTCLRRAFMGSQKSTVLASLASTSSLRCLKDVSIRRPGELE